MKALIIFLLLHFNQSIAAQEKSSKTINFEDELIEGINRKPLDSVNQLSEFDRRRKKHLYYKRSTFDDRNSYLINDLKIKN